MEPPIWEIPFTVFGFLEELNRTLSVVLRRALEMSFQEMMQAVWQFQVQVQIAMWLRVTTLARLLMEPRLVEMKRRVFIFMVVLNTIQLEAPLLEPEILSLEVS